MGLLEDAINMGDEEKMAELSSLFSEGQAMHRGLTGDLPGVTMDRSAPLGFTAPNRGRGLPPETNAALDQLFKIEGRAAVEKQGREREMQRQIHTANVIKQIQGVDPQLQAHILSRMGLDNISSNVPAVASKEQQQMLAKMGEIKFRHDLEGPEREAKRLEEIRVNNARLLETQTQNRAMMEYRAELTALREEQNADKKLDRLRTIAGIIQDGQFLPGVDPKVKLQAQHDLYAAAVEALHSKNEAGRPRPVFRDPGNTHPLAEQGFNPALVSPGSTDGGTTARPGPDLSQGVELAPGVTVREITPGRDPVAAPPPQAQGGNVSIIPPPPAPPPSGVVPGDASGWDWTKDPAYRQPRGTTQLYKNEHGEWIQPGFENSKTRTKVPTTNNPTTRSYRPLTNRREPPNLYRRHKDRAYDR